MLASLWPGMRADATTYLLQGLLIMENKSPRIERIGRMAKISAERPSVLPGFSRFYAALMMAHAREYHDQ
jgi:hypothetical protein